MTTTTTPPATTEVEPADTDTDPPGDSAADPADTVEAPGDAADSSMPEDDPLAEEGEDSPTGFPGGAVLASAADVVAVGGGALVAGAGGAGVMLLAAGGLAAAGAAAAARRTNDRRRREAGRRVGGTARASRRSTGGTPGLTRGRSTSRRGGGVGFGRDGAGKTGRRRRGADPGHGGVGKSGRRRRPRSGRDGTGKSGPGRRSGLFGRGFSRSSPFRRSSSAKSRNAGNAGTGGSKGRSWWGKRTGRNPTTSNSSRRRGALARGRAWLPKLPALGQPWNSRRKGGPDGKRPPSAAGWSWWRGLMSGLRVPAATPPPGARTLPTPAPGSGMSGVAALPRGRHAPRPPAASAVSAEDAVRQARQIRKALAGVKDAVKAIEAAATSAAGARGEDEGPGPTGPQPLGGQGMGQFPLPAAAAEFRSAASQYTPDDMYEFGLHLAQMPAAMADIAEGLKTMAIRTGTERPVNRLVVEALAALYHAQRATITAAEEIAPMFRKAHATDLARRENPRNNEQEWNVQ
ncbi:hypothetical protein [Salinispora arenicola]|uniref:hypothetical protein n=1 Tax=Salinispora arenicola TaxID=168697 RepID=UPI00207AC193|nr:hypothetical protein [Salinispora arenicola]MCN0152577.1 hypothetical protein [Salinispora arenicola]